LQAVTAEFAARHGTIAGGVVALLGMGKLGSRELTAGSDVDLILLYDHAPDAEESDGDKPLAPSHYYTRMTQRLIAAAEAADMRAMIEKEKPPRDLWDIKLIPGGLIDLEFIAQVAVITGQVETGRRATGTAEILSRLAPGFADAGVRQELGDAYALYLALTQMTRLCLTGAFERDDVPPGLSDLLLAVTDLPDFGVLEAHLKETSQT
ncbi:MAG: hypothetical protein E5Y29_26280, partial [Mesorhizobium sp.]